jgi:hypothetical protein
MEAHLPSSAFFQAPADVWLLSSACRGSRIQELRTGPTYERIVQRLVAEVTLLELKRERAQSSLGYFRVCITLQAHRATVDQFHNGSSGYRAQYYQRESNGERALLDRLRSRVIELVAAQTKRTCPLDWVRMSLENRDAKAWIHQGRWIRYGRAIDRHLAVTRWVEAQQSSDKNCRRKARYGGLIPRGENRIDLKGGFLTFSGKPLGTLKPGRARDLHQLGFT